RDVPDPAGAPGDVLTDLPIATTDGGKVVGQSLVDLVVAEHRVQFGSSAREHGNQRGVRGFVSDDVSVLRSVTMRRSDSWAIQIHDPLSDVIEACKERVARTLTVDEIEPNGQARVGPAAGLQIVLHESVC